MISESCDKLSAVRRWPAKMWGISSSCRSRAATSSPLPTDIVSAASRSAGGTPRAAAAEGGPGHGEPPRPAAPAPGAGGGPPMPP
eukprot:283368-Pyramimonas_sp.AAC.1